jgi:hypothetical protein
MVKGPVATVFLGFARSVPNESMGTMAGHLFGGAASEKPSLASSAHPKNDRAGAAPPCRMVRER